MLPPLRELLNFSPSDSTEKAAKVTVPAGEIEILREDIGRLKKKFSTILSILLVVGLIALNSWWRYQNRAVDLAVSLQHYMLLDRNLIYTALTRARELMVVVGPRKALRIAIGKVQVRRRRSGLAGMLDAGKSSGR